MLLNKKEVYGVEDDSRLLLKCVLGSASERFGGSFNRSFGKSFDGSLSECKDLDICEVGVGSGFVISNLAKLYPKNNYFGSDINSSAIDLTLSEFNLIDEVSIDLREGNLLDVFDKDKKFDLIFFNTPYLPCEDGESFEDLSLKDKAIYGGKKRI